jgi:hypothetical protein
MGNVPPIRCRVNQSKRGKFDKETRRPGEGDRKGKQEKGEDVKCGEDMDGKKENKKKETDVIIVSLCILA